MIICLSVRLKELRTDRNLTQAYFAEFIGMCVPLLSHMRCTSVTFWHVFDFICDHSRLFAIYLYEYTDKTKIPENSVFSKFSGIIYSHSTVAGGFEVIS